MFVLGQRLKFKDELLSYPKGFETVVIGFDCDGDPKIRKPNGSDDTFFVKDLVDLVEPICDATADVPTLRDQFAMAALTGMLANSNTSGIISEAYPSVAGIAYGISEAMLSEWDRAK